jgi:hypothetical protein
MLSPNLESPGPNRGFRLCAEHVPHAARVNSMENQRLGCCNCKRENNPEPPIPATLICSILGGRRVTKYFGHFFFFSMAASLPNNIVIWKINYESNKYGSAFNKPGSLSNRSFRSRTTSQRGSSSGASKGKNQNTLCLGIPQ